MIKKYKEDLFSIKKCGCESIIKMLERKFSKEYAEKVERAFITRYDDINSDISKSFYDLKNESLDKSLCISIAFGKDVYRKAFTTMEKNKDSFGKNILVIGCDCGIDACYLGLLLPESNVTAIDKCGKAIVNAKELADRYDIKNVNFINKELSDFNEKEFDSVVLIRMLSELCHYTYENYTFKGIEERINIIYDHIHTLTSCISSLLKEEGYIYWLDRVCNEGTLTISKAMYNNRIQEIDFNMFKIEECESLNDYTLIEGIKHKYEENYYDNWCKVQNLHFNDDKNFKYDHAARFFDYYTSGDIITGFEAVDGNRILCKFCLYQNKNKTDLNIVWIDEFKVKYGCFPFFMKSNLLGDMKIKEKEIRRTYKVHSLKN